MDTDYEVIVIGGGPAGLAAATALARSRRRVLVVDDGQPRNAAAEGAHNVLGLEGIAPQELLARGREQLAAYGAQVRAGRVVDGHAADDHVTVTLDDGETPTSRRLVLAGGAVDRLPDLPGLARHWGGAVVHCPYCHGWEVRGQQLVVLADTPMAEHQALLFSQLSDDVTVVSHGASLDEARPRLSAAGVAVVDGPAVEVVEDDGRLTGLRLAGGDVVPARAVVVASRVEVDAALVGAFGVPVEEHPSGMGTYVPVDPTGRTSSPLVWAAGNLVDPSAQVTSSAAAGTRAGAMVNMDLITSDIEQKVGA